jgi:four helix bundle protein
VRKSWDCRRGECIVKLSDAEAEAAETQVHLDIAFRHNYIVGEAFHEFDDAYEEIIAQPVKMIDQAPSWTIRPRES